MLLLHWFVHSLKQNHKQPSDLCFPHFLSQSQSKQQMWILKNPGRCDSVFTKLLPQLLCYLRGSKSQVMQGQGSFRTSANNSALRCCLLCVDYNSHWSPLPRLPKIQGRAPPTRLCSGQPLTCFTLYPAFALVSMNITFNSLAFLSPSSMDTCLGKKTQS